MAREDPHFRLRLPSDLKERIERAAAAGRRSVNAEIVAALEEKFPKPADFDLGDFLVNVFHPLQRAPKKDRPALIAKANEYLASVTSGASVREEVDAKTKTSRVHFELSAPNTGKLTEQEADELWEWMQNHPANSTPKS